MVGLSESIRRAAGLGVTWSVVITGVRAQAPDGHEAETPVAVEVETVYLPFAFGTKVEVSQGNGGELSHSSKWSRYCFDFWVPEGTPVHAAAAGEVVFVKSDTAGPTGDFRDNNEVAIRLASGAVAQYLHFRQDGLVVEAGQRVLAGDLLGFSGDTGKATGPHLCFGLRDRHRLRGVSLPCRFADVPGSGVPEKADVVTSANYPVRSLLTHWESLLDRSLFASEVDALPVLRLEIEAARDRLPGWIEKEFRRVRPERPDLPELFDAHRGRLLVELESLLDGMEEAEDAPFEVDRFQRKLSAAFKAEVAYEKASGRRRETAARRVLSRYQDLLKWTVTAEHRDAVQRRLDTLKATLADSGKKH